MIKCFSTFFFNLKSDYIFMKDAECAQINEKYIFRFLLFLVFEIWSLKILWVSMDFFLSQKMHNVLKRFNINFEKFYDI